MRGKLKWITVAILAGAAMSGTAQGMTLIEAYEAALLNDPALQSALSERDATYQNVPIGRAGLLPQISASLGYATNQADITNTGPLGENRVNEHYPSRQAAIQLRQPLYQPEALSRYWQSVAQARIGDTTLSAAANDLTLRVISAYFDVQIARDKLAIAIAQRDAFAELSKLNQNLLARGQGTRTDVLETRARYELTLVYVIEGEYQVVAAQATLAAIVGNEAGLIGKVPRSTLRDGAGILPPLATNFEEWQQLALSGNAEIAAMREAITVAEEVVRGYRARHEPRVDAVASLTRNSSETTSALGQDATVRSIGIQVIIPIFTGGATSAIITQALLLRDKAKTDLEAKTRKILVEMRKQYLLVQSGTARIEALSRAVEAARLSVEATRKSISGGERINLDLLQAQQLLQVAQTELTTARYTHLVSQLRLRSTAVTLTAADLQLVAVQMTDR